MGYIVCKISFLVGRAMLVWLSAPICNWLASYLSIYISMSRRHLYTSIPHDLLKSRISNLVHNAFRKKDGSVRYTHIKLTRAKGYFTHNINGGGDNMFTADSICEMIEFLIDNIFVQFGGRLFRQVIGIPMGTNCAPLLADVFLYSYENEFLDNMIRSGHRRLARSFNLCYRYIDDLIVFNNKKFLDYLKEIYPSQLTVEKANKSDHLADYLDLTSS